MSNYAYRFYRLNAITRLRGMRMPDGTARITDVENSLIPRKVGKGQNIRHKIRDELNQACTTSMPNYLDAMPRKINAVCDWVSGELGLFSSSPDGILLWKKLPTRTKSYIASYRGHGYITLR